MVNEIRPDKQFRGDAYEGDEEVPRDLARALDLFDEAPEMHEVLGPEFARVYSIVKRAEVDEFLQVISPWEREHLLLNV
jgi:glutamine synthetase